MANTRKARSFWNRNLSAVKVAAALDSMGADPKVFKRAYEATRKTRTARPLRERLNNAEIAALKNFRDHGSITRLAEKLGKSVTGAASIVSRAVAEGIL